MNNTKNLGDSQEPNKMNTTKTNKKLGEEKNNQNKNDKNLLSFIVPMSDKNNKQSESGKRVPKSEQYSDYKKSNTIEGNRSAKKNNFKLNQVNAPSNNQTMNDGNIQTQRNKYRPLESPVHIPNHSRTFDEAYGKTSKISISPVQNKEQYENMNKSSLDVSEINEDYTEEQLARHREFITNLWQYRYWRLVENAIKTNDWLTVFSFLGEFKAKCLQIAKDMIDDKFTNNKVDEIDHRFTAKSTGEIGIFMIDGIIIRVAKVKQVKTLIKQQNNEELYKNFTHSQSKKSQKNQKKIKKQFDKRAVKNLHQQYISNNILNNLIISLAAETPNFPKIRVPVTCLVSYMGYTFLCQGDSMCKGIETMINGPYQNTFKYSQETFELLSIIGSNLNLKPFRIQSDTNEVINIPFCLTMQLHEVKHCFKNLTLRDWINPQSVLYPSHQKQNILNSPEYYLLNLSKLWPLFIDSNIIKSSGYLRPEAVLSWKKELSNSVFSDLTAQKDEIGQLELAEVCKFVKEDKIKEFATFLDQATFFVIDSPSIQETMHQFGINIRFLGMVADKFTLAANKRIFQIEMVARVLKKIFFTNFQEFTDRYSFKDLFIDFLNLVFVQDKQGQKFYMEVIYPHVAKYYDYQMVEYPPLFAGGGLLHAICYHFGVKVKIIEYPFFKEIQSIFQTSYILDVAGLVKSYDLVTCKLKKMCEKFKIKKREGLLTQAAAQLKLLSTLYRVSSPEGTYGIGSSPQSYYYAELSQVYRNLENYQQSFKYAELSLKGIPDKHADAIKGYCSYIIYYSQRKQQNRCLEFYQKSLANLQYHLGQNHPLLITVYNTLGFELLTTAEPSKCEKIFAKSFQICEQALGYMHSTSGKILLQLADLPLPPEKTINFLLQALTILENIETDKQKVRMVSMKISEMYAKMGNLTKMIHYARKSDHWKMQIIGLDKLNQHRNVLKLCNRSANNVQQVKFMVQKSFSSYIKLLDYPPTSNLYKLFISLKPNLPNGQVAAQRLYKKFTAQMTISTTIVDVVKTTLNNLIGEIPDILKEEDFYVGSDFLIKYKNSRLKNVMISYMDILAIVGVEKAQKIFTGFRKTF